MMTEKYTVEEMAPTRWFYYCNEKNAKGERLLVEVEKIIVNLEDKKEAMNLWKKEGVIKNAFPTWWSIHNYVHDTEGNGFEAYNPTVKGSTLNFDWMLEAIEENLNLILEEVYSRFMAAFGRTATEKKIESIYNYAEKYGYHVYNELPNGWKKIKMGNAPLGSVLITNGKRFRDKERKEGLLLI